MKKLSLLNVILAIVIVVLLGTSISLYSDKAQLYKENSRLEIALKDEKETGDITKLTKDFIEKSSVGKQGDMLIGEAKKRFDQEVNKKGIDSEDYGQQLLKKVYIINVFSVKKGKDKATSYAIYSLSYKFSPTQKDDVGQERIVYLCMKANWQEVKGKYKVYNYKIELLKDSLDDYLNNAQKESESGS